MSYKYRSEKEEEALNYVVENELICNEQYCPWWQEHRCSPTLPTCEGAWCEEAWQQYKDSLEDDPYEEVHKEGET